MRDLITELKPLTERNYGKEEVLIRFKRWGGGLLKDGLVTLQQYKAIEKALNQIL